MPRSGQYMAIFKYNDSIYLFGGYPDYRQSVIYNTNDHSFNYHGINILPINAYGFNPSFSASINDIFYWVDISNGTNIIVYNLRGNNISNTITMDQTVGTYACLSSFNDLLYVSGGSGDGHSTFFYSLKILNTSSNIWLSSIPSMQTKRGQHSCIIDTMQNRLWVIGGYNGVRLDSMERIQITNIRNNNWSYSPQSLIVAVSQMASIYYNNYIVVMGGWNGWPSISSGTKAVQIINCDTGHVQIGGYLNYAVYDASGILVGDRVYLFGGFNGSSLFKTWQYLDLAPNDPTTNPSVSPSDISSIDPTNNPTIYPTINPTVDPTHNATIYPTINPTIDPTHNASVYPSYIPSIDPTSIPIIHPTNDSSVYPSDSSSSIVITICVLIAAVLIIIVLILWYKRRQRRAILEDNIVFQGLIQTIAK